MHILGLPLLPLILLSLPIATHSQCTLNVPDNPLTANGLSTPYELTGCNVREPYLVFLVLRPP